MKRWLLLLLVSMPLFAQELSEEQEARYQHFAHTLRCLVCQNQTIADSNAPLAEDLREQVKSQIQAGRSDEEITRYFTDRYGDFVLYRPPFKARTAALWLGPIVLLALALVTALRMLRRKPAAAPARVDEAALKKLLDEQP